MHILFICLFLFSISIPRTHSYAHAHHIAMTKCFLDHNFYPHLVDEIASYPGA
jgi:hypothetical protein